MTGRNRKIDRREGRNRFTCSRKPPLKLPLNVAVPSERLKTAVDWSIGLTPGFSVRTKKSPKDSN